MRVVLDTNVLISAALKQKSTPGMAALLVERRGGLLKSLATEAQLFEVVARPYFDALIDPDARAWLSKLMAVAAAFVDAVAP
jgi:predicted nucleic acid-binding protein